DWWAWGLGRLGQGGGVGELIVLAGKGKLLPRRRRPETGEDFQLLAQVLETFAGGRERDAVGGVFGLVPAGAKAELYSALAHFVDLRDGYGEQAGMAEGGRGQQGTQADARGLNRKGGKGCPRVGGAG